VRPCGRWHAAVQQERRLEVLSASAFRPGSLMIVLLDTEARRGFASPVCAFAAGLSARAPCLARLPGPGTPPRWGLRDWQRVGTMRRESVTDLASGVRRADRTRHRARSPSGTWTRSAHRPATDRSGRSFRCRPASGRCD